MSETKMVIQDLRKLRDFYLDHLNSQILPFWLDRAIDREYGGYYTCFDNYGGTLINTDKYVWSQGRMIWLFSRLYEMNRDQTYLDLARLGVQFLQKNCRLPNGNCAFLLTRTGEPKEPVPGGGYDTSIYADCFAVLGLAKYSAVAGDKQILQWAKGLYDSIVNRVERGSFRTEPYPIPQGYRTHGIPMILLNTSQEMAKALAAHGETDFEAVQARKRTYREEVLSSFMAADGLIREMINPVTPDDVTMLGRYINPGHSLEDMWFILHEYLECGEPTLLERAVCLVEKVFAIGWDQQYGGLFLFVDHEGGPPKGRTEGFENCAMLDKLQQDWDNKLWWVHSEAIYTTLLAYSICGKESLWTLFRKTHDYTFSIFPNNDPVIREWIQIRDRLGKPINKIVALPVKDPYHIARNLILIIDLIDEILSNTKKIK